MRIKVIIEADGDIEKVNKQAQMLAPALQEFKRNINEACWKLCKANNGSVRTISRDPDRQDAYFAVVVIPE